MRTKYAGISLLLLALLVAVSVGQDVAADEPALDAPIVCENANEEPQDCGPACGDRTCMNQRRNNVVCSKQCRPGCYCKGGTVRNARGICIPSYMCGTSG